jgi:hypothetical protein
VTNDTFANSGASLTGTGLTVGATALELAAKDADADIGVFNGSRTDQTSFAAYAPLINDPQNWTTQDAAGDQSADAIAPDLPFSTTAFTLFAAEVQSVGFAAGSLSGQPPRRQCRADQLHVHGRAHRRHHRRCRFR